MAEWLKWMKGLVKKKEVYVIAAELGISRYEVAGKLMTLWEWCDDNISDAEIDEIGNASVALAARHVNVIDQICESAGFADAMSAAGWLVQRDGSLTFPNYARHNGQTAKTRSLNTLRAQNRRSTQGKDVSRSKRDKSATRKEENKNKEPPYPLELDNEKFREAWEKYIAHRRESKLKKLGEQSVQTQFKKFVEWGCTIAIEAIDNSIRNGWAGIFHPKEKSGKPAETKPEKTAAQKAAETKEKLKQYDQPSF